MSTPIPPEFYENLDHMTQLLVKQISLYRDLRKACRIADLLGIPPKEMTGNITSGVYAPGNSVFQRRWMMEELVIRREGEVVFRARLIDVHQDLWPDDVRAEYERYQKRNRGAP
jgi:hypothetical protein